MADLASKLKSAASRLEPGWSEAALQGLARETSRRLVRRRRVTAAVALCAGVLLLVGVVSLVRAPAGPRVEVASTGEVVVHDAPSVRTLVIDDAETRLEVVAGAARFSVEPQGPRRVVVLAGRVQVDVVGTVFVVERRAREVRVAVDEGVVRVSFDGVVQRHVRAGEVSLFDEAALAAGPAAERPNEPTAAGVEAAPRDTSAAEREAGVAGVVPSPAPGSRPTERSGASNPARGPKAGKKPQPPAPDAPWRDLAAQGAFDEAWRALQATTPRDEPDDLLRAADVARLSGHAAAAVAPLERVVERFPGDARAPLAAFTLGRLFLEDLGAPARAATAFERARALAPRGPLAADALAREVEALAKSDSKARALERARQYLELWPRGPRAAAVRQWGGVREE
ncbi:MAG: tetratricopeptide repeat protein [Myxococcaceae bacterium]|jgi:transmembrane sensor|nr:tetratricopeptide repeat protein [Myxococcaceae bacterium]